MPTNTRPINWLIEISRSRYRFRVGQDVDQYIDPGVHKLHRIRLNLDSCFPLPVAWVQNCHITSASLHRPPIKVKVHRSMTFTLQFAPRRRQIPHHKQLAALNKFTLRRNDHPLVSKLQWRPSNFESEGLC